MLAHSSCSTNEKFILGELLNQLYKMSKYFSSRALFNNELKFLCGEKNVEFYIAIYFLSILFHCINILIYKYDHW